MNDRASRETGPEAALPSGTTIEIRRLAYGDLPAVIAIERRSFPTPWSLAMFLSELSRPDSLCLAALDEGRLAGYLVCSRYDRVWHLNNVAVAAEQRRRGIATDLIHTMFETVGEQHSFTLEVRPSNHPAIAVYEGLGFRSAGLRPGYYPDNHEDAMIMWREPAAAAEPEAEWLHA